MLARHRALALTLSVLALGVPTILSARIDADADGLSDVWQAAYPDAGAADSDPDGDGATNLAESGAGTNPFDSASRFVASAPETDASGNLHLRWTGVSGLRYRIDSSTDLATWTLGTSLFTADQSSRMVRAAGATPRARQFWRVTALDQDTDGDSFSDWEEAQLGSNPASAGIPLRSRFVPFGLCLGGLTASEQIARCQARGFTGMASQDFDLGVLQGYAKHPDVAAGSFKIYAAFWFVNTETPFAASVLTGIEARVAELAKLGAYLWMCCNREDQDADRRITVANVQKVADLCARHGVTLVIYPHGGCAFYSAEQTASFLPRINRPNVKLSIHLCHEIVAKNAGRIHAVVAAVKDHIVLASVSGGDDTLVWDNWASQIKPLDRGTYDVRPYLQALAIHGYTGPMTLMTYNLGDPGATPNHDPAGSDHLTRSLDRWTTLIEPAFFSQ